MAESRFVYHDVVCERCQRVRTCRTVAGELVCRSCERKAAERGQLNLDGERSRTHTRTGRRITQAGPDDPWEGF